jgi:hypothetical protein
VLAAVEAVRVVVRDSGGDSWSLLLVSAFVGAIAGGLVGARLGAFFAGRERARSARSRLYIDSLSALHDEVTLDQ